ncbi:uncharacterized protein LOC114402187 [Glycine soja]|uniref:uncharacterized protein LOC114402187 n=1 Tax=Glycine soja TaxID=3848 RepID=UPI00103AA7AD|nr:uncharacterized protein LOC114402187 [Glycine soja]
MMDNIFLVQEILRKYARKRSSPRCLLKIDLHKTYDSISWEFLDWMLKSMGFPAQFCTWIIECVSSTSFSVVAIVPFMVTSKDSGVLDKGILTPLICIQLSHLAFADDIMLLSRGDIPFVSTMFAKLQHFCRVSRLSISSDKSAIYSADIRPHELSHIQQFTGFSLGDFPFRYLGVPLLSSRLNVCHYAPLLSKITGLIQGWSKKSLSYAGKLELIRAVIQGIVNFWMRIFPLPQSVLDRINASCRNFLWGKVDIGKNKPLVACSVVCSPKKQGGLGLFNLKDWNLALLSRILWDFHCKKDSLWIRWVYHYYFKGSDVWNYNTFSSNSVLIKKIIQIRDFIISKELSTKEAKKRIQSWSTNEQLLVGKVYEYIRGVKPTVFHFFAAYY